MSEIDHRSINITGIVITLTRKIESAMTELGAVSAGLHDKTDALADRLPPEAVKLLHYIAAVRNKIAHEETGGDDIDLPFFTESCETVLNELNRMRKRPPEPSSIAVTVAAGGVSANAGDDVDRGLAAQVKFFWRVLAFVPFLHLAYPVGGILRSIAPAWDKILGVILFIGAIPVLIEGFRQKNSGLIWGGFTMLAIVWLYGAACFYLERRKILLHPVFGMIPVLNISYYIYRIATSLKLLPFLWHGALIAAYVVGFHYLFYSPTPKTGLWVMGGGYLLGILSSILSPKAK